MKNKDYNRNVVIAYICDFVSLFILGYVFSAIGYSLFDKNYKNSMNSKSKRTKSIVGKAVSSFFFFMSLSYHGQSRENPLDERMIVSCIVGLIGAVICFFVLISKDKKIPLKKEKSKNKEEIIDDGFKCDNCGASVSEDASECPKCHAKFIDEDDDETIEELDEEDEQEEMFKCDNCGALVKESAKKCPKCGEKFEEESEVDSSSSNMDKKFSDLNKLKKLLDDKIITKEEFEKEKKKILK